MAIIKKHQLTDSPQLQREDQYLQKKQETQIITVEILKQRDGQMANFLLQCNRTKIKIMELVMLNTEGVLHKDKFHREIQELKQDKLSECQVEPTATTLCHSPKLQL